MKFLVCSLLLTGLGSAAQLKNFKSVYLYPMADGYEQLLANQIVNDHIFDVVSDPKLADAVFTDQISAEFLYKIDHLHVAPAPVVNSGSASSMGASTETPPRAPFTRGKGTVFLVDPKTKQVIWSAYQKPKNTTSDELNKAAIKVVRELEIAAGYTPSH